MLSSQQQGWAQSCWGNPRSAQRTHTSELSLQRGERGGIYTPISIYHGWRTFPHSGKVESSAQRPPSGKAKQALVIRSLRGVSSQSVIKQNGAPKIWYIISEGCWEVK